MKKIYHSSIIDRACRNIKLSSIMRVDFWFEWIDKHVQHDRGHTEEENTSAWEYARVQTLAYFASISHATKQGDVVTIHFKDGQTKEIGRAHV